MYEQITDGVRVSVESDYLEDQSAPEDHRYVWSYTVRIENETDDAVRLVTRYWKITDANGGTQEVRGSGVVGEQPRLEPGERYEYTSGAPLSTPSGIMVGQYQMERDNGDLFQVEVPPFSLDSPYDLRPVN
ncbi:MAG: Co2+/Mg2+ efflux protein ApaG [Pseudomonadota bacterium]